MVTVMGKAFVYWSCTVQNVFVPASATCDCNALVVKKDSPTNTLTHFQSTKWEAPFTYIAPKALAIPPVVMRDLAPDPVPATTPLVKGFRENGFRPPAVDIL